jgi:hypothetical protein
MALTHNWNKMMLAGTVDIDISFYQHFPVFEIVFKLNEVCENDLHRAR